MNRNDLIQMAKEAGFDVIEGDAEWLKDPECIDSRIWWNDVAIGDVLQRFASLVAAHERAKFIAYPVVDVVGPCICGSWPGGKCLRCPATEEHCSAIRQRGSAD